MTAQEITQFIQELPDPELIWRADLALADLHTAALQQPQSEWHCAAFCALTLLCCEMTRRGIKRDRSQESNPSDCWPAVGDPLNWPSADERAAIEKRRVLIALRVKAFGLCVAALDAKLDGPARADAASSALHAVNEAIRQSEALLGEPTLYPASSVGDGLLKSDDELAADMASLEMARAQVLRLL